MSEHMQEIPQEYAPSFRTIEEILSDPKMCEKLEEKIQTLAKNLGYSDSDASIDDIYGRFYNGTCQNDPLAYARLYSTLAIKTRDSNDLEQEDFPETYRTVSVQGNVFIRGADNTPITQVGGGSTLKSLGETLELPKGTYEKVEFYTANGTLQEGYIAHSVTSETPFQDLQGLNGYLRSIGLDTSDETKSAIFKKVYPGKEYRGGEYYKAEIAQLKKDPTPEATARLQSIRERQSRDNLDTYHALVQEFDLRRFLIAQEISEHTKAQTSQIKDNITPIPLAPEAEKEEPAKTETPPKVPEKTEIQPESNESRLQKVYEAFEKNPEVFQYLQNFYRKVAKLSLTDPLPDTETMVARLGKSIGKPEANLQNTVYVYAYAFMKANKLSLADYYQEKTGNSFKNMPKSEREDLFRTFAKYSGRAYTPGQGDNLTIFYGLVIQNELGDLIGNSLETVRQENPILPKVQKRAVESIPQDIDYEKIGFSHDELLTLPNMRSSSGASMCMLTTATQTLNRRVVAKYGTDFDFKKYLSDPSILHQRLSGMSREDRKKQYQKNYSLVREAENAWFDALADKTGLSHWEIRTGNFDKKGVQVPRQNAKELVVDLENGNTPTYSFADLQPQIEAFAMQGNNDFFIAADTKNGHTFNVVVTNEWEILVQDPYYNWQINKMTPLHAYPLAKKYPDLQYYIVGAESIAPARTSEK